MGMPDFRLGHRSDGIPMLSPRETRKTPESITDSHPDNTSPFIRPTDLNPDNNLFVPQRLDRLQSRRPIGRVNPEENADGG